MREEPPAPVPTWPPLPSPAPHTSPPLPSPSSTHSHHESSLSSPPFYTTSHWYIHTKFYLLSSISIIHLQFFYITVQTYNQSGSLVRRREPPLSSEKKAIFLPPHHIYNFHLKNNLPSSTHMTLGTFSINVTSETYRRLQKEMSLI